ncbi:MAG: manganese efflux pump MntP family protein [Clostridia bacterium]|nr:manganese efflux pump MntP family protein [Clostridia bacterium]
MNIIEAVLLAVSLSMDAFAVALCKGLAIKKIDFKKCLIVGAWFGSFQALMPLAGYLLGSTFSENEIITTYGYWIAFVLLAIIGGNMIKESFEKDEKPLDDSLGFKAMIVMAIATSIDALAAGVGFAFTDFNPDWFVYITFILIGIITLSLSAIGVKIGNIFGTKFKSKAELAGGIILILLGIKILLEGLGVIK